MTVSIRRRSALRGLVAFVVLIPPVLWFSPAPAQPRGVELLMFEEPGCPWCRRWREEVGQGYPHTPEGKRAPVRNIELHAALPGGIVLAAPVRFSPTFVLVSNGREVGRITGYPGPDFFWPMLEALLARLDGASRRQSGLAGGHAMQEAS